MVISIFDSSFDCVAILDEYTSFIWTDRFWDAGEFELTLPYTKEKYDLFETNGLIKIKESSHVMIIEAKQLAFDVDNGVTMTISGRSLESILDRRIHWAETTKTGNLQTAIKEMLNSEIIEPSTSDRCISNFIFSESSDTAITEKTITGTLEVGQGTSLFDTVQNLCKDAKIGFRVLMDTSNQFVFSLYSGTDRSYEQSSNTFVIFSSGFENLLNCNYKETIRDSANVVMMVASDESVTITSGTETGYERIEGFKRSESATTSSALSTEAQTYLTNHKVVQEIDAEANISRGFVYDQDYFLGDIVEIDFNADIPVRITEMVFSQEESGFSTYPTFEKLTDDTQ